MFCVGQSMPCSYLKQYACLPIILLLYSLRGIYMELKKAALVLADISGYTRFMRNHKTTLLHAEGIITQLLESVIDKAEFPLTISKLEGDAVFMYAFCPDDDQRDVARDVQHQ